jgi:ribosomal protein L16/L10AE
MLLRPRKFAHKNTFKKRTLAPPISSKYKLAFGNQCLVLSGGVILTAQKMFRLNLLIKKSARRSDKTSRKLWFNSFPHLPLTKKVLGSRMGKGKGKQTSWFTLLRAGNSLFECKNIRIGRFNYFSKQVASRIGVKCILISRYGHLKNNNYHLKKNSNSIKFSIFQ